MRTQARDAARAVTEPHMGTCAVRVGKALNDTRNIASHVASRLSRSRDAEPRARLRTGDPLPHLALPVEFNRFRQHWAAGLRILVEEQSVDPAGMLSPSAQVKSI